MHGSPALQVEPNAEARTQARGRRRGARPRRPSLRGRQHLVLDGAVARRGRGRRRGSARAPVRRQCPDDADGEGADRALRTTPARVTAATDADRVAEVGPQAAVGPDRCRRGAATGRAAVVQRRRDRRGRDPPRRPASTVPNTAERRLRVRNMAGLFPGGGAEQGGALTTQDAVGQPALTRPRPNVSPMRRGRAPSSREPPCARHARRRVGRLERRQPGRRVELVDVPDREGGGRPGGHARRRRPGGPPTSRRGCARRRRPPGPARIRASGAGPRPGRSPTGRAA